MDKPEASFLTAALRGFCLLSAIGFIIATAWLSVLGFNAGGVRVVRHHALYLAALVIVFAVLVRPRVDSARSLALSAVATAAFLAVMVVDSAFLKFFKVPFFEVYPHLPVNAGNVTAQSLAGYASAYLSGDIVLVAAAVVASSYGVARLKRGRPAARLSAPLMLLVASVIVGWAGGEYGRTAVALGEIMNERPVAPKRLEATDRSSAIKLVGDALHEPRTILFVILESAGRTTPSSDGDGALREKLARLSQADGWIDFGNAVTNSNATDVSIPSMLTGTGAHEGIDKVQSLPFVTDLAGSRGYRTALVTSSTLNWAGFDRFFEGARLDERLHAEVFGQPFVNDLTIDDYFAFKATADMLSRHEGKLFVTLYSNALHWPFQVSSVAPVPDGIADRRSRAAFIQESNFSMLFDALRRSDRLDDALIIVVGDHGEFDYRVGSPVPITRVQTFEEGILSPIFLIKAPSRLPDAALRNLRANADRLVASLDLAPTLAHLLGVALDRGLAYEGLSLLDPIPPERVALSTATNEWRSWTRASIAVSRGRERMTCEANELCQLQVETGAGMRRVRQATPQDPLFLLALSDPVMRKNMGKIYRDHFGLP